jgi:hypothetical protein
MNAARWLILACCAIVPAVAYRLGGLNLWFVTLGGYLVAAGLAAWLLHQDDQLKSATLPRAGDFAIGIGAAALLYIPTVLLLRHWVAPEPLLQVCGPRGVWIPRPDAHGLTAVAEQIRDAACAGFARSAAMRGPSRGALILIVACAEEFAWRGGVQQFLSERFGSTRGWILASVLYAFVQLGTGNFVIALLALAGGLLWGALYRYRGRLAPAVFSHCAFSWFFFYNTQLFALRQDGLGG